MCLAPEEETRSTDIVLTDSASLRLVWQLLLWYPGLRGVSICVSRAGMIIHAITGSTRSVGSPMEGGVVSCVDPSVSVTCTVRVKHTLEIAAEDLAFPDLKYFKEEVMNHVDRADGWRIRVFIIRLIEQLHFRLFFTIALVPCFGQAHDRPTEARHLSRKLIFPSLY